MKSCSFGAVRCRSLEITTFARVHNTAWFRLEGQILKCGRSNHSLDVRAGIVLSILASMVFMYCHINRPSPQTFKRCSKVSIAAHCWHVFDGVTLMRCSLTLVGIKSCMNWYHTHCVLSDTGASLRFFHTCIQSVSGQSFWIRISCSPATA